jgi:hypothetical protein
MSRALTAGVSTEPETKQRFLPDQFQGDVEAQIWGATNELWRLAIRRREIAPTEEKLDTWLIRAQRWLLAHPGAPDSDEREAVYRERHERHLSLTVELQEIDERARQCRASLSKHWDRLQPRRQAALRKGDGWSKASSGVRVAADLWDFALRGSPFPGGEHPFALIGFLLMLGEMIYG